MMLIFRAAYGSRRVPHATAVFGSGLVGGAIIRALHWQDDCVSTHFPLHWTDPHARQADLARIAAALTDLPPATALDVVWAAGRTGFACTKDEVSDERAAFSDLMNWAHSLSQSPHVRLLNLHVVSSAGGLFEGQRFVGVDNLPCPMRPYGVLKLEQEDIARKACDAVPVHIYRPSSVYGLGGANGRSGLVNTLIMNAKTHTSSRIFGGLDTIRDYVLAADIGKFIAAQIGVSHSHAKTHLLASGKPAALGEVLSIIYRVVGRPLLIKLDLVPSNANHITFCTSALSDGWAPTDIETGIRQVMRQLSKIFEAAQHG